jgi:sugar phosphate permease
VTSSSQSAVQAQAKAIGPTRVRHRILALAVAAYMITYMDRVVIGTAAPSIQREFGFSLVTIGWILSSFRWGYALFQIPGGWLGDRLGPRRALSVIVTWWSVFTSMTALAWSATSMAVFRFLFGVGEAGAFPIATRALSRWILPSERGFAQGITHAGSRLGAALTPPLVVAIIAAYGWRAAFVCFGLLGIVWSAAWVYYYRDSPNEHRGANALERRLITGAVRQNGRFPGGRVPWRMILSSRTLWYASLMYFCYAYCLSVYLDWFPTYLKAHRGFSASQMGVYAALPLAAGTMGDLLGGWLSDVLLDRGIGLKLARRSVAVFGFTIAAAAMAPAAVTPDPAVCVWLSCLAVFGLELTVGVSWALPLDIAAEYAGSTSSVMNMSGNIGGALSPAALAYLVRAFGWDAPFLVTSGLCAAAALLFFKIDASRSIFAHQEGVSDEN